jgi:outer membrane beta-barrel protein
VELLNGGVPFIRRPLSTMGIGIVWSPFYGKINTFNSIVYFDWSFGLGYAKIQTESNLETARVSSAANRYDRENYNGAYVKSAVKFHVNQNWHVGIEWVGTQYFAPGPRNPKNKLHRSNNDLILQLGWSY